MSIKCFEMNYRHSNEGTFW